MNWEILILDTLYANMLIAEHLVLLVASVYKVLLKCFKTQFSQKSKRSLIWQHWKENIFNGAKIANVVCIGLPTRITHFSILMSLSVTQWYAQMYLSKVYKPTCTQKSINQCHPKGPKKKSVKSNYNFNFANSASSIL